MAPIKMVKDNIAKFLLGKNMVPSELIELQRYFRLYGPIHFENKKEGEILVSKSIDFKYGSIITQADTLEQLDENIKDAILTSFGVPSAYKKEAGIVREDERRDAYAVA